MRSFAILFILMLSACAGNHQGVTLIKGAVPHVKPQVVTQPAQLPSRPAVHQSHGVTPQPVNSEPGDPPPLKKGNIEEG